MKTEGLTNQLIEAIKILKHVKAQNIEQNKMIDAFLERVLKELGAKDEEKKKEDKSKTPDEERKEQEENMKRGEEMIRRILEMKKKEEDLKELEDYRKKKETRKELEERLETIKRMEKLSVDGTGKLTAPYVPMGVSPGLGAGISKPILSPGGTAVIDTSRDHKGGGAGTPADRVIPPGKVWCTTCEEFHDAGAEVAP